MYHLSKFAKVIKTKDWIYSIHLKLHILCYITENTPLSAPSVVLLPALSSSLPSSVTLEKRLQRTQNSFFLAEQFLSSGHFG